MKLKQLLSLGLVLMPVLTYAQQVPPQDSQKSKEKLLLEKHEQEKLLLEREHRLLKEKHELEYNQFVQGLKKQDLKLDVLSKEDRIKLQAEKELKENPFAVKPEHPEEKSKLSLTSQIKFKTETIDLSKGRFKVKGLNSEEDQTVTFSEKEMPLHLVESAIDLAPLNKKGTLLKHRNEWISNKIPSLLSEKSLEKEEEAIKLSFDPTKLDTNIPQSDKEFIGKSGSRILEEDEIILQLDSTIWYEYIAENDSVPSRKTFSTFNEEGRRLSTVEHRKNTSGEWGVYKEESFQRDENGILMMIEIKELVNGTLTTVSETNYKWTSDLEGSYERYEFNQYTQQLEPTFKRDFKYVELSNPVEQFVRYEKVLNYTFNKSIERWVGTNGYEYSFDENGFDTGIKFWDYYNNIQEWVNTASHEYILDEEGRRLSELYKSYSRAEQGLVNYTEYKYAYDQYGNNTIYERYRWNKVSQEWVGEYKSENEFDADGDVLSRINYDWDVDVMDFVADYKVVYVYSSEGDTNTEIAVRSNWDTETESFIPDYRDTNIYKNEIQVSSVSEYYNRESEEWIKDYKYEYAFDENGNQTEYKSYYGSDNVWIKNFAYDYEYDGNGNLLEAIIYKVVDNEWVYSILEQNTYDSNDNKLSQMAFDYNGLEWIKSFKNEYAFDENSNRTLFMYYRGVDNEWIKKQKYEYAYDTDGREILRNYAEGDTLNNWLYSSQDLYEYPSENSTVHTYQYWSTENASWVNSSRYSTTYGENSRTEESAYWNSETSLWENSWKHEYTYNDQGREIQAADYTGNGMLWVNYWLKTRVYNTDNLLVMVKEFEGSENGWSETAIATRELRYNKQSNTIFEEKIAPEEWDVSYKYESAYDENNNQILEIYLDGLPGSYYSGNKYERAYKEIEYEDYTSNRRILDANYDWSSEDQVWVGNYKYEDNFDANGNRILDSYVSDWEDSVNSYGYRYIYEYDDMGYTTLSQNQDFEGLQWVNDWEDRYVYDDNGNQVMYSYQYSWDTDLGYYKNGYKYDYTYNELDLQVEYSYSNFVENNWVPSSKDTYSYDSEGRRSEEIYSYWNSETSVYDLSNKRTWDYINDYDYNFIRYYYSSSEAAWMLSYISDVIYDFTNNIKTETSYSDLTKENKEYEYKYLYASGDFNYELKYQYTDFANPEYNKVYLYERHFDQNYFKSTYDLKVRNDSLISSYDLVIEDSTDGVLTSRTYYTNTNTSSDPIWVKSEQYMYEFTDGVQSGIAQYSFDGDSLVPQQKYSMTYSETDDVYTDISYSSNDSAFVNSFKKEFKTNEEGETIAYASYYWDSDSEMWYGDYRYDEEGSIDKDGNSYYKYADYNWDYSNNVWRGSFAYQEKFDEEGNLLIYVNLDWDYGNLDWVQNYKDEYTYDENQTRTSMATYNWSESLEDWVGSYKRDYDGDRTAYSDWKYSDGTWQYVSASTSTSEENVSTRIEEEWFNDSWINTTRVVETYGDKDIRENYEWSSEFNNWHKESKSTNYSNEEGQYVYERAIGVKGEWVNEYRRTTIASEYDGDYSKDEYMYENWNEGAWVKDRIEENFYNYYDYNDRYTAYYKYDMNLVDFVPDRKETYNNYIYTWNPELEDWLGVRYYSWENGYTERWDNDLEEWVLHEKEHYMYSPVIVYDIPAAVGIHETPSMEMNILTTAPGLALTTSGAAASVDGLTVTFEEAGTLELTISTPEGETSEGTPYTAREIKVEMQVEEALSLEGINLAKELVLYPNPASDFVNVSISSGVISQIDLFTISGVSKGTATGSLIDIRGLSKGVYILKITTDKGVASKTLVVD